MIWAMGQIVKQVSEQTTRYYWYPGDKREWVRAGVALFGGLGAFGAMGLLSRSMLISVTVAASVTALIAGLNFGRRDYRAAHSFPDIARKGARRAAVAA